MWGSIIVLRTTSLVSIQFPPKLRMLTYPLLQVLFPHFRPFHPCRPHSSLMGEGDALALFRHRDWHLICSFYRCKSTILTYLMVIGFVSPFSPPVGYTPLQPMGVSMIALRTSLQVSIQFIMSLQIQDTNLSFYRRFYFHIFALFTPAGPTPHWSVGVSIIHLRTSLLAFNQFLLFTQIHNTNLSYGCRIIFPFLRYTSLRFGSLLLLVTVCITMESEEK
jgi:hypothetical protein